MAKFRKRPVEIEASLWRRNGDHPDDYRDDRQGFRGDEFTTFSGEYAREKRWEGHVVRYFRRPDVPGASECKHCGRTMHEHGWIDTLEGGHIVCPGDWIIKGVAGEFYPCKPDIFAATYEPVGFEGNRPMTLPTDAMLEKAAGAVGECRARNIGYCSDEDIARAALSAVLPDVERDAHIAGLKEALRMARTEQGD